MEQTTTLTKKILVWQTWTFILLAATDFILTKKSMLIGGYYETNPFTNTFGLLIHFMVLSAITSISYMYVQENRYPSIIMILILTIFNIWWGYNNIISYQLLT